MTALPVFVRSLHGRDFLAGTLTGVALAAATLAGLLQLGAFRGDSEALLLSADYRLSRTESELREEVRYLQSELELQRRSRSTPVQLPGPLGF